MNLVVQAPDVPTRALKELAQLGNAREIQRIAATAFRLLGARANEAIAPYCARAALDAAWVPPGRRLRDFGLFAIDMDSTLITIECIDELAALHGCGDEVATLTAAAMRGEIDMAESLRARVALLAGLPAEALETVWRERVALTPGAQRLIERIHAAGLATMLITSGFDFFAERLRTRLSLRASCANRLEIDDGVLTGRLLGEIVDAHGKARALTQMRAALGLDAAQVIVAGDGANDIPMMGAAGVSVAWRAKPAARAAATHALDHADLDGLLHLFE